MVAADPDVLARIELGTALTHQDVAGMTRSPPKRFHAEALRIGIAAVAGGACALFRGKKLKVEMEHSRAIEAEPAQGAAQRAMAGARAAVIGRIRGGSERSVFGARSAEHVGLKCPGSVRPATLGSL